jgi:hypothetical protein
MNARRKQMKQDFSASPARHRARARAEPRSRSYAACLGAACAFVRIEDLAHALASTCCFAGQTRVFYSLAQHDYLVSMLVPPHDALAALLLDAGEALQQWLPQGLEDEPPTEVLRRLGVATPLPATVAQADLVLRATELRDLGPPPAAISTPLEAVTPLALKIQPLLPLVAKYLFLDRYYELRPREDPRPFATAEGTS